MDLIKTTFLSGVCTLFAQTPDIFEGVSLEKIGFGSLLFLIIWVYLYKVLPKSQEQIERLHIQLTEQQKTIASLCEKLNDDDKTISKLTALMQDKLDKQE